MQKHVYSLIFQIFKEDSLGCGKGGVLQCSSNNNLLVYNNSWDPHTQLDHTCTYKVRLEIVVCMF